jgi:hypothetical protein
VRVWWVLKNRKYRAAPFGFAGLDAVDHDDVLRADLVGRRGDVLRHVHRHLHAALEEFEELGRDHGDVVHLHVVEHGRVGGLLHGCIADEKDATATDGEDTKVEKPTQAR